MGHVVIIDDARCFCRDQDYLTLQEVIELIRSKRPIVDISIQDDSIRVLPKNSQRFL